MPRLQHPPQLSLIQLLMKTMMQLMMMVMVVTLFQMPHKGMQMKIASLLVMLMMVLYTPLVLLTLTDEKDDKKGRE